MNKNPETICREDVGWRQLNERVNDSMTVAVWWNGEDDSLKLTVQDAKFNDIYQATLQPDEVKDAFIHPDAYRGRALNEKTIEDMQLGTLQAVGDIAIEGLKQD
jgi:hypothetical protein